MAKRSNMDPMAYEVLLIFLQTVCYASFCVVPITVYIMDKRFSLFVKSAYEAFFRGNRVSVVRPIQNH